MCSKTNTAEKLNMKVKATMAVIIMLVTKIAYTKIASKRTVTADLVGGGRECRKHNEIAVKIIDCSFFKCCSSSKKFTLRKRDHLINTSTVNDLFL